MPRPYAYAMLNSQHAASTSMRSDPDRGGTSLVLLCVGTVALFVGVYLGFIKHSGAVLVFTVLGGAMALFAIVGVKLFKSASSGVGRTFAGKSEPNAATPATSNVITRSEAAGAIPPPPSALHLPATQLQPPADVGALMPAVGASDPAPDSTLAPEAQSDVDIPDHDVASPRSPAQGPEARSAGEPADHGTAKPASDLAVAPKTTANREVSLLMETKLGDLLLAALREDPEGAGRIFARAVAARTPDVRVVANRDKLVT